MYQELLKVFQETRSKGRHLDFNWIYSNARKITRELTGDPNAIGKQHVSLILSNGITWKDAKSKEINGFLRNTIAIVLRNDILHYMKEVSTPVPQTQITTRSGEAFFLIRGWMLTSLHYPLLAKQPWRTKRSNPEMKKTERSEFGQLNQTLGTENVSVLYRFVSDQLESSLA